MQAKEANSWKVFIQFGEGIGEKNSFSLAAIFRFHNIEFIFVLFVLRIAVL